MSAEQHIGERTRDRATELDELRDAWTTAEAEIEAMLSEILDGLPTWATIDRDELRELYQAEICGENVMIGPTAASVVALRVEAYLESESSDSHIEAQAGVVELVVTCEEIARTARAALEQRLEDLVTELAEVRETSKPGAPNLDALKARLRKGKVGAALQERETQADELEAQRKKADELRLAWAPLMDLADVAAEMSADASEQLAALLELAEPPPLPTPAPVQAAEPDDEDADEVDDEASELEESSEVGDDAPANDGSRTRLDTDAPRNAQDTPLAAASVTATMEVIAAQQQFREPAFRILTSWHAVKPGEAALAVGVPSAYVLFMTCATLAYHLGLTSENPFVVWPAALWMYFAFALWAVGMPALSGWRFEWDGKRPRPVRMSDRREGGFVEITDASADVGNYSYDFESTSGELRRWSNAEGRGWTLVLTNDDGREAHLAAVAESPKWEESNSECDALEPEGYWRVSEEALLHIFREVEYW